MELPLACRPRARPPWQLVPLVVLLGLGAHVSKNALAPAEPALEALGLPPVAYALVSAAPVLAAVVFPAFWGLAFRVRERLVLLVVPGGILAGQVILVGGLALQGSSAPRAAAQLVLFLGLVVLSVCRAGGEVVQHTLLARVLSRGVTTGFVALIFCTHLTVLACNWTVPRVLAWCGAGPHRQMHAITVTQVLFTIPSVVSVCSAALLAHFLLPHTWRPKALPTLALDAAPEQPWLSAETGRRQQQAPGGIRLLVVWGALVVGLLHALQSVTNQLIVSHGSSALTAGSICAQNQALALVVLPFAGALSDCAGQRVVLVLTASFLPLAGAILAWSSAAPLAVLQAALIICAVAGVILPALALALIPSNTRSTGAAYGILDSLKSLTQAAAMLLIGALREVGGFPCAMTFVCLGLSAVAALSAAVACVVSDEGQAFAAGYALARRMRASGTQPGVRRAGG